MANASIFIKNNFDTGAIRGIVGVSASPMMRRNMLRRGIRVQTQARRLCPVDTGRLRSSIGVEQFVQNNQIVTSVGTDVEYAVFVENGTRYMAARSFLRPALAAAAGG